MTEARRLFAAVPVEASPEAERLLDRLRRMGSAIRPVRPGQLHLTVKFFGTVEADLLDALAEAVRSAAVGVPAFEWSLTGTGAFPSPSRPSVVWAGTTGGEPFSRLAAELDRLTEPLGFAPERRPFRPHVTLARVKFRPPAELAALLAETAGLPLGPQRATELVLFESDFGRGAGPHGPGYTRVVAAPLGG